MNRKIWFFFLKKIFSFISFFVFFFCEFVLLLHNQLKKYSKIFSMATETVYYSCFLIYLHQKYQNIIVLNYGFDEVLFKNKLSQ
jgi:predicted membrane-bound spermidine synthase